MVGSTGARDGSLPLDRIGMVETAADTTQRSWLGGKQKFAASRLLRRRLVPLKNAHQAPERIAIAFVSPLQFGFFVL